jgi:DNA-binding transcriptional MerR regulator/uncharacterized glyoxalase superfamily protein PhnB
MTGAAGPSGVLRAVLVSQYASAVDGMREACGRAGSGLEDALRPPGADDSRCEGLPQALVRGGVAPAWGAVGQVNPCTSRGVRPYGPTVAGVTTGHKVGELAAAAGLTVRTLHYYEEIGLLVPSARTPAGHRLYDDADVERLYRIRFLRRLGLALGDVVRALDDPAWSLRDAVGEHLAQLNRRLEAENRLRARLTRLLATDTLDSTELLSVMEDMTMLDSTLQRRISILVYTDLDAAFEFLTRVFGLGPGTLTRGDDGTPVHGELQAGDGMVWLHPEAPAFGLASPRTAGAATACMAVMVDDVDAHHRHAMEQGAVVEYEPVDQSYGYREYSARDTEGGLWSFMKPLD